MSLVSRIALITALSLALSPHVAAAQRVAVDSLVRRIAPVQAEDRFAAVDTAAGAAVADGEVPSVAYAISRNGRLLHAAAVGEADRERGVPATLRTAYPLASLTKPITATALLVQSQDARLMLDTPVSELLPSLKPAAGAADPLRGVTLDRLLHHTAGLGTYARIRYGDEIAHAVARSASSQRPYIDPVQPPGRVAEYSNLGYGLLGEVIAARSGMSFAEYARRRLFAPLRMRDAFIADTDPHGGAIGYDANLAPLPPLWNDTPGAGNAYASVDDLLRFGAFHLDPTGVPAMTERLPPAVVMAMRLPDADGARHPMYSGAWYGQGWYVRGPASAPDLIWHEGGMPGASVLLALYPKQGLLVAVLVNRSDAQAFVQSLADRLVRATGIAVPPLALDPVSGFVPLGGQTPFTGRWKGTIRVDGEHRPASLSIDSVGAGRLSYTAAQGEAATVREFRALWSGLSLVSAVQGPWRSVDAPNGAAALLLKLTLVGGDRVEGALVAYEGPERLRFLLPYPVVLHRVPPP